MCEFEVVFDDTFETIKMYDFEFGQVTNFRLDIFCFFPNNTRANRNFSAGSCMLITCNENKLAHFVRWSGKILFLYGLAYYLRNASA